MAEMRKVMCESIIEEMKKNDKIVVINSDLGKANGTLPIADVFPDRLFDAGVAEQNMAAVAAGMASYGMVPIINSFCAFATRRICDQAAISIAYAGQNVKIIGTDPGITAELNGGTHMTFEDIAVMRSIPNMVIMEPCDEAELRQMIAAMCEYEGPVYMRLYRKVTEPVHGEDYRFRMGKADVLKEGRDVSVICSGILVQEALAAEKELAAKGIDAEIINIHTIKPIDRKAIVDTARKTGVLVTAENHNILGGLRSAVAEVVTEESPVKIYPVGVNNLKGEVGKLAYLKEQFGLTAGAIVAAAEKAVAGK
ncbi:MAG: transketolase C-terminal domain-containing protein [Bacillota bacterium]|nr:transketolase C-terminal domain-containing protein [Bacillota bacterium]